MRPADPLATEAALRTVIDTALAAVVIMDEDGDVTGWGGRAEQILGWSREEIVGRRLGDVLVPPQYRAAHHQGLENFRRSGEGPVLGQVLEVSALHRDGREIPVELRISPASEIDGRVTFIAFLLDITERKQAADRLAAMYAEARAAHEATASFANMVVHELRAPLTVIAGYASMLRDDESVQLPAHYRRFLTIIESQTAHLCELVDNLLFAARLDAGHEVAVLAPVDLAKLAAEAVDDARARADLAGGTIELIAPEEPVRVTADPVQARRILDNLLGNAVAYGGTAPRVVLTVTSEEQGLVSVADQGVGIPEEMRESIFDRFVRVSDRAGPAGTGLGLFISRQLAERQSGSLVLEHTAIGGGSTFTLRLPLHAS